MRLSYYIDSKGRHATFVLRDVRNGHQLAKVKGKQFGHEPLTPEHLPEGRTLDPPPKGDLRTYPLYEVIDVDGIVEIVEHRHREPIFYISDDPAVRTELLGRTGNTTLPK